MSGLEWDSDNLEEDEAVERTVSDAEDDDEEDMMIDEDIDLEDSELDEIDY